MAYSAADLSAEEIALAAADKPILGALVAIGKAADAQWSAGNNGDLADADNTEAGFGAKRAVDGFPAYVTKPGAAAVGHTLCYDFGAAGIDIDAVAYLNHNFKTLAITALKLEIADDNLFAVNLITISDLDPSALLATDTRLIDLTLETAGTARRYSTVRYLRVTTTSAGAVIPQLGELLLMRRRQMRYKPDVPFDSTSLMSGGGVFITPKRVTTRYEDFADQFLLRASWVLDQAADKASITGWWTDTGSGRRPWVWIYDPDTTPAAFHLVADPDANPQLLFPTRGPFQFNFTLGADEQGPDSYFLAQE